MKIPLAILAFTLVLVCIRTNEDLAAIAFALLYIGMSRALTEDEYLNAPDE